MAIGRVHDEDSAVPSARRPPGPLDVRDEKRQVSLGQLGIQLAAEGPRVEARVAVVAGRLVLRVFRVDTEYGIRNTECGMRSAGMQSVGCRTQNSAKETKRAATYDVYACIKRRMECRIYLRAEVCSIKPAHARIKNKMLIFCAFTTVVQEYNTAGGSARLNCCDCCCTSTE